MVDGSESLLDVDAWVLPDKSSGQFVEAVAVVASFGFGLEALAADEVGLVEAYAEFDL